MTTATCANGVAAASAAAGPIVVGPLMITSWLQSPSLSLFGIGQALVFLFVAMIVGLFLSMFPNAIGAAVLSRLGCERAWARWPVVWAIVGAAMGWLIQLIFGGLEGAPVLAVVGGTCALICRWGTRWQD